MTRDDIIRLAREAKCGFTDVIRTSNGIYRCIKCGKVMDEQWKHYVAAAIRARGET